MGEHCGQVVLELPPRRGNPRNSEGAFIELHSGRLLFVYTKFTSGNRDDAAASLVARHSDDGGRTWSGRDRVIVAGEGRQNVMSVSLLRLHDGRIALFYLVKNGTHDCRLWWRFSTDEARTWSAPRLIIAAPGYHVVLNDRVVQLRSGRIIVPASFHRRTGPSRTSYRQMDWRGIGLFFISDDGGAHWREARGLLLLSDPGSAGIQEPGVVELNDGRLLAFARTSHGVQYASYSEDQGESWTPPAATGFTSPVSPLSMKRAPSGALLAVWNDHSLRPAGRAPHPDSWERTPLVLATSHDEGRSWGKPVLLETDPDQGFCYAAIHFPDRDHVLLAYTHGGAKEGWVLSALRIRRISLSALGA